MARTDNLTNYLEDVATAIKNKKGDDAPIKASEFDTEIENLPSGGGDDIEYFSGEISAGASTTITSTGWIKTLKKYPSPKKILGNSLDYAFSSCMFEEVELNDLDASTVTSINYMFQNSQTKKINFGDNFNPSNVKSFYSVFQGSSNLTDLDCNSWDMSNVTSGGYSLVSNCNNLTNFKMGWNLGKAYLTSSSQDNITYTLNLSSCSKLTHESALDVINKVYDIASIGVKPQQIKFHANTLALLSEEEIAIATEKGWNVTT